MNKWLLNVMKILLTIIIPLVLLATVVQYYTFDDGFYMKEFEKYKISEKWGIEEEALLNITDKLIGYLAETEDDLIIYETVKGKQEQIFEAREIQHMVDVKHIFIVMDRLKIALTFIALILLGLLYKFGKKRDIFYTFISSTVFYGVFLAALAYMINSDFSKYFIKFHEIFFTNDLWLLDPRTDILIQMLPQGFFVDIATAIILTTGILHLVLCLVAGVITRGIRRAND